MIDLVYFLTDYFPELARQKRLLDRKHQGRRRNYWNKVPRKEREKDEQDEEYEPRWVENEAFEGNDDIDEKQEENITQEEQDEIDTQDSEGQDEIDTQEGQDEINTQEGQDGNDNAQEEENEIADAVLEDYTVVA